MREISVPWYSQCPLFLSLVKPLTLTWQSDSALTIHTWRQVAVVISIPSPWANIYSSFPDLYLSLMLLF